MTTWQPNDTMLASTPDTCTPCFVAFKQDFELQRRMTAAYQEGMPELAESMIYAAAVEWHGRHREEAIQIMDMVWGESGD